MLIISISINYSMSHTQVKQVICKILQGIVKRYQADKFQPYLLKISCNHDIQIFITDIFQAQNQLRIIAADIKEILEAMAKDSQLLEIFGNSLLKLWLEFEIIDHFSLKDRLHENQLDNYPNSEKEQLEFLKQIDKKYANSYSEGDEKLLLNTISQKPVYQSLKKILKQSPSALLISKIGKSSVLKSSNLKPTQLIGLRLLKNINDRIAACEKNTEKEICSQLKEMFDRILQSTDDIEKQLVEKDFKEVIFNLLHIDITKHVCTVLNKTNDCLKISFNNFKKFYSLTNYLSKLDPKQDKDRLLDQVLRILEDTQTLWYWPCLDGRPLITFLRNYCIRDKQKMQGLIELLNKYPPKLKQKIYNLKKRQFIQQAFQQIPEQNQKGNFVNLLLNLCKLQEINLEEMLDNGSSCFQMAQDAGIPIKKLQEMMIPDIETNMNVFYVLDADRRKKEQIQLCKQDVAELLEKITNSYNYQKGELSFQEYHLSYQITNQTIFAHYKTALTNKVCRGYLMFNLLELGPKLKQGSWIIVSLKGERFTLTQDESEEIGERFFQLKKKQEERKFNIKIRILEESVEINTDSLEVKLYSTTKQEASRIKLQYGYLVFIPSYKTNIQQQMEGQILENPISSADGWQKGATDLIGEQKQEKIQNRVERFKYLALFKEYFEEVADFTKTEDNHIQAHSLKAVKYFQNWIKTQCYQLISKNLLSSNVSMPADNQQFSRAFKVPKRLESALAKKLTQINQKLTKKLEYDYISASEVVLLKNMKPQKQSRIFFELLFQYLSCWFSEEAVKKSYVLDLNSSQLRYVKQREKQCSQKQLEIVGEAGSKVEILCSKAMKQSLLKDVNSLNQIHQFMFENREAFQFMKTKQPHFLEDIQLKEGEKSQNFFKVSFQLKHLSQFRQRFRKICQELEDLPGKRLQIKVANNAPYLHLYRQKLMSIDPEISIIKMEQNLLIQYNSKTQKIVMKALQEITKDIEKEMFEILRKSSKSYQFKNIDPNFVYCLREQLEALLNELSKAAVKAILKVEYVPEKDIYRFQAVQISEDQEKILAEQMALFQSRLAQFKTLKSQLYDTKDHFNKAMNKIPFNQKYQPKIKALAQELKTMLKEQLTRILTKVTDESFKKLEAQFLGYLKKGKFGQDFQTKCVNQKQAKLLQEMKELKVFGQFVLSKVQEARKESAVKNPALKQTILKQLQPATKELDSKYAQGSIFASHIKRLFKSLNILLTIYFGQQLPITAHLQQFSDLLKQKDVVMVKVGTGSGKSTVIPPYLIGLGYKKVVVTQPRRLPCRQIYQRITQVFGEGVAGYQVADRSQDLGNSLIYMTDGLLKMRSLFSEEAFDSMDVLVIDQIHQRSANIDILLLLLTEYYKKMKRKLKLVLCSATIDSSIKQLFTEAKLDIGSFEVETNRHKVQKFAINEGTIIDKVLELSRKLQRDQQMLVFIPGEAEVSSTVKILGEKFNKLAFPLTAHSTEKDQESTLKNGQIFVSTSIAETSLTFSNLKYVVDSGLSRWRKFNPEVELMETEESYSSKSSMRQRQGRLGRTCPGEYYYLKYHGHDPQLNREHNVTQLERVDLTQYIFQLLLRNDKSFDSIVYLLRKLKHQEGQFRRKIAYSKDILESLLILKPDGTLQTNGARLMKYGNLGMPQHNMALFNAEQQNCLNNMIYLVAFQIYGMVAAAEIISYSKRMYKGGDIRVVHDFLVAVGNKIGLATVQDSQILQQLQRNCSQLADKPWFNLIVKIMAKCKQLMAASSSNLLAASSEWDKIVSIMAVTYKNKVFFNQSLFGGNNRLYEKITRNLLVNYEDEPNKNDFTYIINTNSNYQKDKPPSLLLALNCDINATSECILSVCQQLKDIDRTVEMGYRVMGADCKKDYFTNGDPLDEKDAFDNIYGEIRNKSSNTAVTLKFPTLEVRGYFTDVVKVVRQVVEPKRRNKQLKLNLRKFLDNAVEEKKIKMKWNKNASEIDPEFSVTLLERLTFEDYQRLFKAMKYEMKNKFSVDIEWDVKQKTLKVVNAKNVHLNKIIFKVASFFTWFSDCQIITRDEFKVKPHYIGDCPKEKRNKVAKVIERVNQIVDSSLEPYILKGWVSGRGPGTKHTRTARMIAVCWVLVNCFNCTIKGGFVRDWVVNGEQWIPNTIQQLIGLLQKNPRNPHLEVLDQKVTPNDIDAELPESIDFDVARFRKEMKKLGIVASVEDDGWRKHIVFDYKAESGGFTADLIEPYTSLTHYTYDFDVNVMYIKKDYTSAIGMKIPLVYENEFERSVKKVDVNDLIDLCMEKKMTALKTDIPKYRMDKFTKKQWTIAEKALTQPICYKSHFTQSFSEPIQNLQKISPLFYKMVNDMHLTVLKIEQLRNKSFDDAFEASQNWIISQLEKEEKKANPNKYDLSKIHSNNKVLFHGVKTAEGAKGIKESGFDSRFFSEKGLYGKGAYFADDPAKSHAYTSGPERKMFLVNVALGKQEVMNATDRTRLGPAKGYHSILGKHATQLEYIIDRWGQAKPLYLITYK